MPAIAYTYPAKRKMFELHTFILIGEGVVNDLSQSNQRA